MASLSRKIEFYWLNVKPDAIREKFEEIKALPLDLKEEKNSFFLFLLKKYIFQCDSRKIFRRKQKIQRPMVRYAM